MVTTSASASSPMPSRRIVLSAFCSVGGSGILTFGFLRNPSVTPSDLIACVVPWFSAVLSAVTLSDAVMDSMPAAAAQSGSSRTPAAAR